MLTYSMSVSVDGFIPSAGARDAVYTHTAWAVPEGP
jgi:hypothetical protein